MAGNTLSNIEAGQGSLALSASRDTDWWVFKTSGGTMSVRVTFAVADAVGTLALQSYPGQAVPFLDENETTQTSLAVTSGLNGLTHEFVLVAAPATRYRLAYTRTSGGAADSIAVSWS